MPNDRDTHFLGFAKLLFDDIEPDLFDIAIMNDIDGAKQRIKDKFAQRAYDLVYHTLANTSQAMAAYCEHRPDIPENVLSIPDLTQWPD